MTVASPTTLRVTVTDVWDTVHVPVRPDDTIATIKAEALRRAMGRAVSEARYQVKYRGALVLDEHQTVAALGIPAGAPLIVLPARRRPVR
jgi:hypothetical protein